MSAASGSRYLLSLIIRGIFFGRLLHCGRGFWCSNAIIAPPLLTLLIVYRDRSGGMAGPRVGGSKDSTSMRHSSNRPMSSSPSRMTVDSHYQNRGANYPQHSGNDGNSVGGSSNVAEGVYSNKRLIHACTCLIGTTVQVRK